MTTQPATAQHQATATELKGVVNGKSLSMQNTAHSIGLEAGAQTVGNSIVAGPNRYALLNAAHSAAKTAIARENRAELSKKPQAVERASRHAPRAAHLLTVRTGARAYNNIKNVAAQHTTAPKKTREAQHVQKFVASVPKSQTIAIDPKAVQQPQPSRGYNVLKVAAIFEPVTAALTIGNGLKNATSPTPTIANLVPRRDATQRSTQRTSLRTETARNVGASPGPALGAPTAPKAPVQMGAAMRPMPGHRPKPMELTA